MRESLFFNLVWMTIGQVERELSRWEGGRREVFCVEMRVKPEKSREQKGESAGRREQGAQGVI